MDPLDIFKQLKGHKHLVVGNHDEQNKAVLKLPWESISWYKKIKENGMKAIASHYPFETWSGVLRGYFHVHGHSHGTLRRKLPRRFDVGADVEYTPVLMEKLHNVAAAAPFLPTDHHGDI
jgi:calcineurin-like phosphoesterase family protein